MQNTTSTINLLLRRTAAFIYDCLLLIALFFVTTAVVVPLNDGEALQHWSYKIVLLLIAFLFFDWFWRHGGQTLGMRAWRIRVESQNAETLTFNQTMQRFLVGCVAFGFTMIYMLFNAEGHALHDKLSKTKIVKYYN